MLAKLLLRKTSKNHYQLNIFKALCTVIEFGYKTFVKFLVDSKENFKIDDRKGSQAL
jgi:hypothetical protein